MSPHAARTSYNSSVILDNSRRARYQFNVACYNFWKTKLETEKRPNLRAAIIKNCDDAYIRMSQSCQFITLTVQTELYHEVMEDFANMPAQEAYDMYKWRSNECAKNNAHFMAIHFSI